MQYGRRWSEFASCTNEANLGGWQESEGTELNFVKLRTYSWTSCPNQMVETLHADVQCLQFYIPLNWVRIMVTLPSGGITTCGRASSLKSQPNPSADQRLLWQVPLECKLMSELRTERLTFINVSDEYHSTDFTVSWARYSIASQPYSVTGTCICSFSRSNQSPSCFLWVYLGAG